MSTQQKQRSHERMIDSIVRDFELTADATGRRRPAATVIAAMREVDRSSFVPSELHHLAWENRPLPIGQGQTISQPFIVALMTDVLDVEPDDRVLEIGTGCGYQAAVLSRLAESVFSLEIIPELATSAAARLATLGFRNVVVENADGHLGRPSSAPYDAIMVTAATAGVPPALLKQLAPGGRMVIPLERGDGEFLTLLRKNAQGGIERRELLAVRFVPLTGGETCEEETEEPR